MAKIDWANVVGGIGRGIGHIAEAHKQATAQNILKDPKSTPMQQALAWASLGKDQAAAQTIKQSAIKETEQTIRNKYGNLTAGTQPSPNVPGATSLIAPPEVQPGIATNAQAITPLAATARQQQNIAPEAFIPGAQQVNQPPAVQPAQGQVQPTQVQPTAQPPRETPEQKAQKAQLFRQRAEDWNNVGRPDLARGDISQAEALEEDARSLFKLNQKDESEIRAENRKQIADYSKDYTNIQAYEKTLKDLKEAQKLIASGKVSLDENVLRNVTQAALEGKESLAHFAEFFKTPEQQKLFSLIASALKTKEIGGSNPSTREVLIAMMKLPSQYKGTKANLDIIGNMVDAAELDVEKAKTINDLRKDQNQTFPEFNEKLNQRLSRKQNEFSQRIEFQNMMAIAKKDIEGKKPNPGYVFMVNPETGKARQVLVQQVPMAQAKRGVLLTND